MCRMRNEKFNQLDLALLWLAGWLAGRWTVIIIISTRARFTTTNYSVSPNKKKKKKKLPTTISPPRLNR